MLDSGRAVGDFSEIVASQFLLLFHAEGTMVGRNNLEVVHLQTLPELRLVRLLAQRRRHYILRALEIVAVIIDGKEKVLRASLGERGDAAIASLTYLVQSIGAREVDDV